MEVKKMENEKEIDISLVVPAYNEEGVIAHTIDANRVALYGVNYEIIVVNDGSTDATKRIVNWLVEQHPEVKLIDIQKNKGKHNALNEGIACASGQLIVCSDADSYLCKDAYQKIKEDFDEHKEAVAMVGLVHPSNSDGLLAKLQAVEYLFEQRVLRYVQSKWRNVIGVPGPFFAFRREDIDKMKDKGGEIFNNSMVEDFELAIRMNAKKLKIYPTSEIIAYTKVPETVKILRKQRLRWFGGTLYETLRHKAWRYNPFYGVNLMMMFVAPVFLVMVGIQLGVITLMMDGVLFLLVASFFAINTVVGALHAVCVRKLYLVAIFVFPLYLLLIYLLRVEAVIRMALGRKIVWGR